MKKLFINDFLTHDSLLNREAELLGWVKNKRTHKNVIFLDIIDSTGVMQAVFEKNFIDDKGFELAAGLKVESAVSIFGVISAKSKGSWRT